MNGEHSNAPAPLATDLVDEECEECAHGLLEPDGVTRVHLPDCSKSEEYDPTPWCTGCGARKRSDCHCGPIAENN